VIGLCDQTQDREGLNIRFGFETLQELVEIPTAFEYVLFHQRFSAGCKAFKLFAHGDGVDDAIFREALYSEPAVGSAVQQSSLSQLGKSEPDWSARYSELFGE